MPQQATDFFVDGDGDGFILILDHLKAGEFYLTESCFRRELLEQSWRSEGAKRLSVI